MTDLRALLREGADVTPGLPDVPDAIRRGRAARRRRTASTVAAGAGLLAVVLAAGAALLPLDERTVPDPAGPVPSGAALPERSSPLVPGDTYDLSAAGLPGMVTIPDRGWALVGRADGWVSLRRGEVRVVVQTWEVVVDPLADPVRPRDRRPAPEDLSAWLADHPRLAAGPAAAVPGAPGWMTVPLAVVDPLEGRPEECLGLPCVLLAEGPGDAVELLARERGYVYLPRGTAGHVVLVALPAARGAPDPGTTDLLTSLLPTLSEGEL